MLFQDIYDQPEARLSVMTAVRNNRLSHALLLKGVGGVGKLPFALAVAQYVNCSQPTEEDSCGQCANCRKIAQGIHPDVHFILPIISKSHGGQSFTTDDYLPVFREQFFKNPYLSLAEWSGLTDAENKQLSISIAEIRALKKKIELKAFEARYKVVIIWHAEKIRTEAANAFLKLLEEPPDDTLILMTVEDTTKLLATILSRCQLLKMNRLSSDSIRNILIRDHQTDPVLAEELAMLSEGSLSKAIETAGHSQASFALAFMKWMELCYTQNTSIKKLMDWSDELAKQPKEYHKLFFEYALQKIRDAMVIYAGAPDLAQSVRNEKEFLQRFTASINLVVIEKLRLILEQTQYYITRNANTYAVLLDAGMQMQRIFQIKG